MKINSSLPSIGANEAVARTKGATELRKPAGSGAEQVELSSVSAHLQGVQAAAANTPVADSARVAEIKQAISEGRFQINPERIADGLLDSVRQMLARQ